ncbi:Uu.00g093200.m01.CDS01 [Anthostomella pinea]|uniref:Uu.00g093200.m01.CDS01 n=1 Tax=Anthostomella pinea TaxID=933095 RepID=A0AAI8VNG6_9PEZI|nr:Uu.00g093200.m01.CDS01 [Anthostomella pinea]
MAQPRSPTEDPSVDLDPAAVADFHASLRSARRVIAVIGAGLSAASGLPTYRGAGGLWRNHDVTMIASPVSFIRDPGLVWQFNTYWRHLVLSAKPNAAHFALAELAKRMGTHGEGNAGVDGNGNEEAGDNLGFVMLTQNIDGLSARADHPAECLKQLHGCLLDLRCWDAGGCGYVEYGNLTNPVVPALAMDEEDIKRGLGKPGPVESKLMPKASMGLLEGIARKNRQIMGEQYQEKNSRQRDVAPLKPPSEAASGRDGVTLPPPADLEIIPEPRIAAADLPQCPRCKKNLLRPRVIWFGENLPADVVEEVDAIFADPEPIDLCLVIGTSSSVWPAAGYTLEARKKGARVAVVNTDPADAKGMRPEDWTFVGDAAAVVPVLLEPVIGQRDEWMREV